jgi:hypothetical protein
MVFAWQGRKSSDGAFQNTKFPSWAGALPVIPALRRLRQEDPRVPDHTGIHNNTLFEKQQ